MILPVSLLPQGGTYQYHDFSWELVCIKDPWTKPNGGRIEGERGGSGGRKMETTVLEQQ